MYLKLEILSNNIVKNAFVMMCKYLVGLLFPFICFGNVFLNYFIDVHSYCRITVFYIFKLYYLRYNSINLSSVRPIVFSTIQHDSRQRVLPDSIYTVHLIFFVLVCTKVILICILHEIKRIKSVQSYIMCI